MTLSCQPRLESMPLNCRSCQRHVDTVCSRAWSCSSAAAADRCRRCCCTTVCSPARPPEVPVEPGRPVDRLRHGRLQVDVVADLRPALPVLPVVAGVAPIDAVIETKRNAIDNPLASSCQRARLFALTPDRTELNHILWGFVHRARFALQGPSRLITSSVPHPKPRWRL